MVIIPFSRHNIILSVFLFPLTVSFACVFFISSETRSHPKLTLTAAKFYVREINHTNGISLKVPFRGLGMKTNLRFFPLKLEGGDKSICNAEKYFL